MKIDNGYISRSTRERANVILCGHTRAGRVLESRCGQTVGNALSRNGNPALLWNIFLNELADTDCSRGFYRCPCTPPFSQCVLNTQSNNRDALLDRILWTENVVRKCSICGRFPENILSRVLWEKILSEILPRFSDSGNVVRFGKCCPFREMLVWDFTILPARKMFKKCGATANRTDAPQLFCKLPLAYSHENRVLFSWKYTTAVERCCCVSGGDKSNTPV